MDLLNALLIQCQPMIAKSCDWRKLTLVAKQKSWGVNHGSARMSMGLLLGLLLSSFADANDALSMRLSASKVETNALGQVSYIPVKTAKAGTVIQYRATYRNKLTTPIHDLVVTLPIPQNMAFTGEAYPPSAQASIDDKNYVDMPLYRRVDGDLVKVPYAEYASLRWNIKYLPAHKTAEVALNAVLN